MAGCLSRGVDMHHALEYDRLTMTERGFTNLVDALAALEPVVFTDRVATLTDIARASGSDFRGHDALRRRLLSSPKWATDDGRADGWARSWLSLREKVRAAVETETGMGPLLTSHLCGACIISKAHGWEPRPTDASRERRWPIASAHRLAPASLGRQPS